MKHDTESKEALEKERILVGSFWKLAKIETEAFTFEGISLHRSFLERDLTAKRIKNYNKSDIIKTIGIPKEFYLNVSPFEICVNNEFYNFVSQTEHIVLENSKKGVFISSYPLPNILPFIENQEEFREKYQKFHIENGSIPMDKERLFSRIVEDTYDWNKLGSKR